MLELETIIQMIFSISKQTFLNFPIALGAYCSISLLKLPDLSLESAYVFGAILSTKALILTSHLPLPLIFLFVGLAGPLGGMSVGFLSAVLTSKTGFPHLLSAMMVTGIFHGLCQFVLGSSNVSVGQYENLIGYLRFGRYHPEVISLFIVFIVLVILGYLFLKTELGYALAVHGNNHCFFENHNMSRSYIFIIGILISNGLAGLGGYLDTTSAGFVDLKMGALKALFCIISLILGKTFVRTKKPFTIWIPIVGVISYFTIQQLLLKVGFNLRYYTMVQSLIVLLLLILVLKRETGRIDHLGV